MDFDGMSVLMSHYWIPVRGHPGSVLSRVGDHFLMTPVVFECARCGSVPGIPSGPTAGPVLKSWCLK